MKVFCKAISFITHPVFTPFLGVLFYFYVTPEYIPEGAQTHVLISVGIITIIIPLIFFILLKYMKWISSIHLPTTKERKIPLFINILLIYIIITKVFITTFSNELHYYFLGILFALWLCFILVYIKIKASMHSMGMIGLTCFICLLSIHYERNFIPIIITCFICIGAMITSRLYLKAHNVKEIIVGLIIGALPQLILAYYWL
ncbi:hypothetical protein ACG2LH_05060 [Zhouia sp. PK063]|uniref:hypothetical protein n=1 Tax=Zhouia sp. PK063 TaxID=3373602 RepID=UPI00378D27D6